MQSNGEPRGAAGRRALKMQIRRKPVLAMCPPAVCMMCANAQRQILSNNQIDLLLNPSFYTNDTKSLLINCGPVVDHRVGEQKLAVHTC